MRCRWDCQNGWVALWLLAALAPSASLAQGDSQALSATLTRYCTDCHNADDKTAGLAIDTLVIGEIGKQPESWERVARKLRVRQMPPADMPRPDEATYAAALKTIEGALDAAAAQPNPGRTNTFRRLTRTEYQNAIRDLLGVAIDAAALLPADESSGGFDNITVGDLSPTLLDRYLTAAQTISRLAIGRPSASPGGDTIRIRPDITQENHIEGLPLGTRGGALIPYTFPQDGEYEIQIRLARDRNEEVEGLHGTHELELLLDRRPQASFRVAPPEDGKDFSRVDAHLKTRISVTAGPKKLGVTFVKQSAALSEARRQPYQARFNFHRHPRQAPAVYQVSITGPFAATGPGKSPSREWIFICRPRQASDEDDCARQIIAALARRAYRRPATDADLQKPLELFRAARADGDFDAGIEMALSAVLISPHFLFRIERDPPGASPGEAYRLSDLELASRLSFFLWSSIPDEDLLGLAESGRLSKPDVLKAQVRRMLADERSRSLATNFADQWLHLRNLDSITPDLRLFPDFDDNLRQALRRETELLIESVVREDRSVLELLSADYTFLNERLAKHYEIPHVYGSRMRRYELQGDEHRGGLLRQGSILTVTSYATRTSPVIRGKWILENLVGTPPPPPPADVPALKENTVSASLPVRARLAEHRANQACASCHKLIDPPGFALENYDAVGRWRTVEESQPIDASGGLPDGSTFEGTDGLEQALLKRPEVFAAALTEKLLTFALGRGVEYHDAPAVRKIVREAAAADFRFSSLIEGIATSTPFQMRRAE